MRELKLNEHVNSFIDFDKQPVVRIIEEKDDDEQVLRLLLLSMCMCALTCFDAVEGREREERRRKKNRSLTRSFDQCRASIRT